MAFLEKRPPEWSLTLALGQPRRPALREKRPPEWSLTLADHWPDWMPEATEDQ